MNVFQRRTFWCCFVLLFSKISIKFKFYFMSQKSMATYLSCVVAVVVHLAYVPKNLERHLCQCDRLAKREWDERA